MRSVRFAARFMVALLALFLIASQGVRADEVYGKIRGVVTDKTGATLPGVKVTAVNINTGLTREAVTNNDGSYLFDNLPVGQYKVTASGKGFKTYLANNIPVILNRVYALNIPMELGEVNETVNVEANPVQVETTNSQLGTVISGNTIVDMPLNGRNWVQLQQTIPGVVASSDRFANNFATNGSQSQQNSYLINGTDSNDLPLNSPLIVPSPDAIGEFNLVTNTINPEYGRNSGAILNAVIKSGTNAFHGSAFDFYRDPFLNASDYFTQKPAQFHQNQFGGTIGGPIVKDHTFFFFSYQGTRNRRPTDTTDTGAGITPGNSTVFTQDQRNGLFPDIATSTAKSPIPLVGENGAVFPAGTPYSTIFPTGSIPAADFNPISLNLLNTYVPLPNSGTNSFVFSPTTKNVQDQEIVRIDQNLRKRDQLWGSAFWQRAPQTSDLPFTGADLPGFGQISNSHQQQYTIGWNHIFSATTLNEARVGYTRLNFLAVQPAKPTLPSSAGFTGITPQDPSGAGLPTIALTGFFTLGFSDNGPQPRIDQTYQFTDNFSHLMGNHGLKFGFEMRRFHVTNPFFAVNNGHFDFGGSGPFSTGDPGADFLLGIPDDFNQGSGGVIDATAREYYMYFQDQWKMRRNFTLTYGAGYQIDTPLTQKFNKGLSVNCFRPGEQSTVFPTAPTGLVFPGDPGCNSAGGPTTRYGHVGPRLGFAWDVMGDGKTSLRGGYGVYFNRSEEELTLQTLGTPPFGITSFGAGSASLGGVPSFGNPYVDISGLGAVPNPFPFAPPQPGAAVDFTPFEPFSITVLDPNFSTPYAMNYNLTLQRELPSQVVFSLGYVGSQGRKTIRTVEQNPGINPAGCAADPTCVADRTIQFQTFPQNFVYPGDIYGSIGQQRTDGNSNYNSLQISARKNMTHGITFLASYTWSHSLDNASSFENSGFGGNAGRGSNPFDRNADYSDSAFDARHRAVFSYTWDLPSPRNGFLNRVIGGFRFSGITTFQTGFPVFVRDTAFRSLECTPSNFYACWDAPNQLVAVPQTFDPRNTSFAYTNRSDTAPTLGNYWFNPNDFAHAAFGTIGNARRAPLHGPGINNTDLALFKDIRVNERSRFELRLEGFNVFNHTQFKSPNNNVNSANFGRILSAQSPRLVQLGAKFYF